MATIKTIEFKTTDSKNRHSETRATYSVVYEGDAKHVQIDTYGSASRVVPQVSQSIRVNEEIAKKLVAILLAEFPSIAT